MKSGHVPGLIRGLFEQRKFIESQFLYDARGSDLFEQITRLPEYYLTRTEIEILNAHAEAVVYYLAAETSIAIVELGAGDYRKVSVLLDALARITRRTSYVPIDVSTWALSKLIDDLRARFPSVEANALNLDFLALPKIDAGISADQRLLLFLGSSIGNFRPKEATALIGKIAQSLRPQDMCLIGFDLIKDPQVLLPAYFDNQGVTSSFNLNLLTRLQSELNARLDPAQFRHYAFFDPENRSMESYLLSLKRQTISFPDLNTEVEIGMYEGIHTESSFKYDVTALKVDLAAGGLEVVSMFFDEQRWFVDVLARAKKGA